MRSFRGLLSTVIAVVFLGCAAADSIGPRVPSGTDVNAAKNSDDGIPKSAKVYCVNATSCYAAAFEFTDYHGLYTVFTAYFQNLQGTYPPGGPSTPLALNLFRFDFFGSWEDPDFVAAQPDALSVSAVGNVQVGESNYWPNDASAGGPVNDQWDVERLGIVGCNGPELSPYPLTEFAIQTCPSQGLDGWAKVDFTLRHGGYGNVPKQKPVRFKDFLFSFGDKAGARCTIGGELPGTCTELSYRSAMR